MSKLKLIISDTVEVPVKFAIKDGAKSVTHSVILLCHRLDQSTLLDRLEPQKAESDPAREGKFTVASFMDDVVVGWRDQRLVVDEAGAGAEFSAEAKELLFSLAGFAALAFKAYLDVVGAVAKN